MLKIADNGGRGVRKMLTKGGGGVTQMLTLADKGGKGSGY